MRVAIVGTGIAANSAAWALAATPGVALTVYEKAGRVGGHCHTVEIDYDGERIAVDTGFIVFNELNYPNFSALLNYLDVPTERSTMGFSLSSSGGAFEWSGREHKIVSGFFARRRNLFSLHHYHMLFEMFRFNRQAVSDRKHGKLGALSLHEYLDNNNYSQNFRRSYLLPMAAAIWSMPMAKILEFPAASFVAFFDNHRLLHWNRPAWRTVSGGSRRYVGRMMSSYRDKVRLNTEVMKILPHDLGVDVLDSSGRRERYDHVVIGAHTDETLAMIADPTADEQAVLSSIPYRENRVYLHRDETLMPKRRAAWASWNVAGDGNPSGLPVVTYWMNALQNIDEAKPIFISLNPPKPPAKHLLFSTYQYSHPQYDNAAVAAQTRLGAIQGKRRLWFCGAWTGYGFHEDGVVSGLSVAESLGATTPWRLNGKSAGKVAIA